MTTTSYSSLPILIVILSLFGSSHRVTSHQMALSHAAAKRQTRLMVPAYFDPENHPKDWSDLIEAAQSVPIVAIVNVSDGPGKSVNQAYKKEIDRARHAGVIVVGYVIDWRR